MSGGGPRSKLLLALFVGALVVPGTAVGLDCGQIGGGTTTPDFVDVFGFDARGGEVVSITVAPDADQPGFEPHWQLRAPDNTGTLLGRSATGAIVTLQDGSTDCDGQCEATLPDPGGTFDIEVFDAMNGVGNYNLSLLAVSRTFNGVPNGPPDPVCGAPIYTGNTASSDIGVFGDTDAFTFDASAGSTVTINLEQDTTPNFDAGWELFAPDGTLLALADGPDTCLGKRKCCSGRCRSLPLPDTGTFTIKVFDFNNRGAGSYDLTLTTCGNGAVERDEDCDQGALNGTAGSCCSPSCTFRPAGQTCRPAANICDAPETCGGTSGVCPADGPAPPGTTCADGDLCTLEDSCQAGTCMGRRVCSVDVEFVRESLALVKKKVRVKSAPLIVRCDSLETGQARRGSCSAHGVLSGSASTALMSWLHGVPFIHPDNDGAGGCDSGMPVTTTKTVRFNESGIAMLRLKLNPLGRRALKKLIDKQPVFVRICTTVTRPNGMRITIPKQVQLVVPCSGGPPSSVCGVVSPAERTGP